MYVLLLILLIVNFSEVSTFWVTHPNNELSDNAAAGGEVGTSSIMVVVFVWWSADFLLSWISVLSSAFSPIGPVLAIPELGLY